MTPGLALDWAFDFHRRRLGAIAAILGRFGTRMGLEVLGVESLRTGAGPTFIARMGEPRLAALLEQLDDDGHPVGILVDAWHLYAAGESLDDALRWGVGRVVWAHVADLPAGAAPDRRLMDDRDRGLPGENGAIDVRQFLGRLAAEGYDGPVTAEPMAGARLLVGLDARRVAESVSRALIGVWPEPSR